MGIYIKGMEMPNNCAECQLNHDAECAVKNCMVTDDCYVRRASWCPIILVPPHGRLIDADASYEQFLNLMDTQGAINPCQLGTILMDAPTIIPAEPCNDLAKPNNDAEEGEA